MKATNVTMLLAAALALGSLASSVQAQGQIPYTDTFFLEDCRLSYRGVNDYFIPLVPGSFLRYEGEDDGEAVELLITVLSQTRIVNGVRCAVVREKEWVDVEIVDISWKYLAFCRDTKDIFYFGEDVVLYEDGGAWLAGQNGNKPGLLMPGRPLNGARYYQEIEPGVALDRAEHLDDKVTVQTPAGTFQNCLFVAETSPLEPGHVSEKHYARGVSLIQDGALKLVAHGFDRHVDEDDE